MPETAIDDSLWAEMTAAQQSETVRAHRATLRQMVAGLLDGPDELGQACREVLARTDASLKELTDTHLLHRAGAAGTQAKGFFDDYLEQDLATPKESEPVQERAVSKASDASGTTANKRRRLGLPRGYLPRLHRHERLVRTSGVALSRSGMRAGSNDRET